MSSNTWHMTLTTRTDKNAVYAMRDFLRQRGVIVPMRDRDVVTKYLHRLIETGNARNLIEAPASLTRPDWQPGAAQKGYERIRRSTLFDPIQVPEWVQELALGTFGLLVLLACYVELWP